MSAWAIENPLSVVFLLALLIWSIERMFISFVNRNKIMCNCECCSDDESDDESEYDCEDESDKCENDNIEKCKEVK